LVAGFDADIFGTGVNDGLEEAIFRKVGRAAVDLQVLDTGGIGGRAADKDGVFFTDVGLSVFRQDQFDRGRRMVAVGGRAELFNPCADVLYVSVNDKGFPVEFDGFYPEPEFFIDPAGFGQYVGVLDSDMAGGGGDIPGMIAFEIAEAVVLQQFL